MNTKRAIVVALCGCVALLNLAGCPWADARTSDGGGGDILSAGSKIIGGTMTGLNQDEIQIVTDTAISLAGAPIPPLSNEQADAVVDFIRTNQIDSIQDIQNLVTAVQEDPNAVTIPESVLTAFGEGQGIWDILDALGGAPDFLAG
ncbi:MAG: hypothetical protein KKB50_08040 [Planctomycetes bacterium]|nr:hypothetical protein [Planctomycetota bacterium]